MQMECMKSKKLFTAWTKSYYKIDMIYGHALYSNMYRYVYRQMKSAVNSQIDK